MGSASHGRTLVEIWASSSGAGGELRMCDQIVIVISDME